MLGVSCQEIMKHTLAMDFIIFGIIAEQIRFSEDPENDDASFTHGILRHPKFATMLLGKFFIITYILLTLT